MDVSELRFCVCGAPKQGFGALRQHMCTASDSLRRAQMICSSMRCLHDSLAVNGTDMSVWVSMAKALSDIAPCLRAVELALLEHSQYCHSAFSVSSSSQSDMDELLIDSDSLSISTAPEYNICKVRDDVEAALSDAEIAIEAACEKVLRQMKKSSTGFQTEQPSRNIDSLELHSSLQDVMTACASIRLLAESVPLTHSSHRRDSHPIEHTLSMSLDHTTSTSQPPTLNPSSDRGSCSSCLDAEPPSTPPEAIPLTRSATYNPSPLQPPLLPQHSAPSPTAVLDALSQSTNLSMHARTKSHLSSQTSTSRSSSPSGPLLDSSTCSLSTDSAPLQSWRIHSPSATTRLDIPPSPHPEAMAVAAVNATHDMLSAIPTLASRGLNLQHQELRVRRVRALANAAALRRQGGGQRVTTSAQMHGVETAALSPDGTILAVAHIFDYSTSLWDVASGLRMGVLRGHSTYIRCIGWSPCSHALITGADDGRVIVWDVARRTIMHTLSHHADRLSAVAWSNDGRIVATASKDKTTVLWQASTGRCMHILKGHQGALTTVEFSPDSRTVATASVHGSAWLWDVATGTVLTKFKGQHGTVVGLSFAPHGSAITISCEGGGVAVWDVATGELMQVLSAPAKVGSPTQASPRVVEANIPMLSSSEDGQLVAVRTGLSCVAVLKSVTGELMHTLRTPSARSRFDEVENEVTAIAWRRDNRILATGACDGTVSVWDGDTGVLVRTLGGHSSDVQRIMWTPDGRHLVVFGSSLDGPMRIYRHLELKLPVRNGSSEVSVM